MYKNIKMYKKYKNVKKIGSKEPFFYFYLNNNSQFTTSCLINITNSQPT